MWEFCYRNYNLSCKKSCSGIQSIWFIDFWQLIWVLSSSGSRPCPSQLQKTTRSKETLSHSQVSRCTWVQSMSSRLFHRTTICQGDNHTGKNFLPPIKTKSPVVKAVKLMACRQAKSPLKITTCSAEERSASHIYWQLTNCNIHKCLCLPPSHQFD